MPTEKRHHERVPAMLEVVWEGASGLNHARLSDLSLGGCYLDTIGEATVGETINFKVRIPAGHWLPLRGEIIYCQRGVGLGVRFPDLTEGYRKLLSQLIDDLRAK